MSKPQSLQVLALLRDYGPLGVTQQDAIRRISCYRLAARISDLKAEGYVITAKLVGSNGHRYARYFLDEAPVQLRLDVA